MAWRRRRRNKKSNSKKRALLLDCEHEPGERTNVHHRKTKNLGGSGNPSNLSRVTVKEHQAFNILFNDGHMPVPTMALKLSKIWIDPNYLMIGIPRQKGCAVCGGCQVKCSRSSNEQTA